MIVRCPKCGGDNMRSYAIYMNGSCDCVCLECRHRWREPAASDESGSMIFKKKLKIS